MTTLTMSREKEERMSSTPVTRVLCQQGSKGGGVGGVPRCCSTMSPDQLAEMFRRKPGCNVEKKAFCRQRIPHLHASVKAQNNPNIHCTTAAITSKSDSPMASRVS